MKQALGVKVKTSTCGNGKESRKHSLSAKPKVMIMPTFVFCVPQFVIDGRIHLKTDVGYTVMLQLTKDDSLPDNWRRSEHVGTRTQRGTETTLSSSDPG